MNFSFDNTIFETPRLTVRRYTAADLDYFFQLNGNEDVMRYIRPAQSLEQSKEFLQRIIADYEAWPGMGRWAMFVKDEMRFVGSFAIIPIENSDKLQLGYALIKNNWGKGYATESVKGGIRYAFEKLGLNEIAGITYPQNEPSQNVLLKNGFVFHKTFMEEDKELNMYLLRK
ncbi:MAG TPA: GNAT family N-acetyltransferase [Chitinophagaceae bacterium]|nr:GNAT family N-acetyltransferase [Chitinophagaceae bacterium]